MDILLSMHSSIFLRTELSFGHCMLPAPFSASRYTVLAPSAVAFSP